MPQTPFIWLIDDDLPTVDIIEQAFRKEEVSCQLRVFTDTTALLTAMQQRTAPPTLLLVDYYMPDTDGLALIERLKNNPDTRSLRSVLFSRRITADILRRAEELAVYQVASKPNSFEEWRHFVKDLCLAGFFP